MTAHYTPSDSQWNTSRMISCSNPLTRHCGAGPRPAQLVLLALLSTTAWAQLPEGPGKAETERICKQCHELERSLSPRQDRAGWQATMDKMVALGAKGTQQEFNLIVDYMAANFPAPAVPRLNVNKATAVHLESP